MEHLKRRSVRTYWHRKLETENLLLGNKNGKIEFGSSTTQLAFNLSNSLPLNVFDHLVISDHLHESMLTYFIPLSKDIQCWYHTNYITSYNDLFNLITDETTLVVLPHVSNVTGHCLI